MIFALEFRCQQMTEEAEKVFAEIAKDELKGSIFKGLIAWPEQAGDAVILIAESDGEAEVLGEAITARASEMDQVSLIEVVVRDLGEPPAEIDALSSDERLVEIIRGAVPQPGAACGRCGAILPPHLGWCPWDLGGPEKTLGHPNKTVGKGPEGRPMHPPEPVDIEEKPEEPIAAGMAKSHAQST